jgi:Domain of unknown function (DUF4190)/zinc-ribbon domain
MRCPNCNTPNPPDAERCSECGEKLPLRERPQAAEDEGIEDAGRRPASARPRRRPAEDFEEDDEDLERRPRYRSIRRTDSGDEVVSTIIPYKNPKALIGYYCSIVSLLPILGFVLGPAALTLGIMGLRHVRRRPEAHGTAHAIIAIVLGSIGTLISLSCGTLIIIGLLSKK